MVDEAGSGIRDCGQISVRSGNTLRACVVTNIPAPYRVPVLNALARTPGLDLHVLYCAAMEPDRQWNLPVMEHAHGFLSGYCIERSGRYIHVNPGTWSALRRLAPQVVVTNGFNPTHLLAWGYARARGAAHVAMTDGTDLSEAILGPVHRFLRRRVYSTSSSFVAVSQGGIRLLESYGAERSRIHRSPLIANPTVRWYPQALALRDIDLLWSGRFVPAKNLPFALQIAAGTADRLGRTVRLAVLGGGPQKAQMQEAAAAFSDRVEAIFAGHVAQEDIPGWYARSRLLLFPTKWDVWGVVANEACEAGVPVIVSPHAGAAGELVVDGLNGRVLQLDESAWIAACTELLSDQASWHLMSMAAQAQARSFGLEAAAGGMADAIFQAANA